jgi:hypothetical protein
MMRSIRIFVFIWLSLVFILDVRAFFAFVKVKPLVLSLMQSLP